MWRDEAGPVSLIQDEDVDAILRAEDEAIAAAEHPPEVVSDGTIHAEPGTPLADLIEALNGDQAPVRPEAEAQRGPGG